MKSVKAVIFDVYHTLLAVEPGPVDAAERWVDLWRDWLGTDPAQSLSQFDQACRELVTADHARRKAEGTLQPEVDWREIARLAAPVLSKLTKSRMDGFLFGHAGLQRTTCAMPGAADFLERLRSGGIPAGIASNAQRYTLDEMSSAGIPPSAFAEGLCFWSFEQGFSKPDPAVFAWLTQRLAARGIFPEETLMIGDRWDNDVAPARAAGWQTWHFQGIWPEI